MRSVAVLKDEVDRLYRAKKDTRADLADWLHQNHIYIVAERAADVARRFGADSELAYAAGLLHDIADTELTREDPMHEQRSAEIARKLLGNAGFSEEDISMVVDDALRFHSCRGDERPQTNVGKAVATGDAVAHLTTDFYPYLTGEFAKTEPLEEIRAWVQEKISRDYDRKIAYEQVREEMRVPFEQLKKKYL